MDGFRLGDAQVRRVEEQVIKTPLREKVKDETILAANLHWMKPRFLDENGNWDQVWQSWILHVDGKTIVIDPCNGNGRHNPLFPASHMLNTPYIERFAATGVRPEDVDFVFCTHLHFDHCGWNTQLRGGRYVPTFPNARYIFVRREYERWDPSLPGYQPIEVMKGVFENSVRPVVEAGLAEIVGDSHRISPSLLLQPAYGHTAGHSWVHLESATDYACFVGDVFHHPIELVKPELESRTDEDPVAARATRRRLVEFFLAKNALIVPGHFPDPHAGRIRRDSDGRLTFIPMSDASKIGQCDLC